MERVVAHGARTSNSKAAGPVGRVLRDATLPMVLRLAARSSQAWLHEHHIEWDAPVTARSGAVA